MSTAHRPGEISVWRAGAGGQAVTALILGIAGTLVGLAWFGFLIAFSCGITAAALGVLALRAAPDPGRKKLAIAGLVLGIIAIGLSVLGFARFLEYAEPEPTPDTVQAPGAPKP